MPLFLIAIRIRDHVERLAVVASTSIEALGKARAARPLAPRDAFHVTHTGDGDVMTVPARGRPVRDVRHDPELASWAAMIATLPSYTDID
jgi:hypothetical protein